MVCRPRSVEGKDPHYLVSCTLIVMGGAASSAQLTHREVLNTLLQSSKISYASFNMNSRAEIKNKIY